MNVDVVALLGDEGDIDRCVAALRPACGVKFILVAASSDEPVDWLACSPHFVIDLVIAVRALRAGRIRRRGPCADAASAVGRTNVKLDNRVQSLRWDRRAEFAVVCEPVAVESVVEHRKRGKITRWCRGDVLIWHPCAPQDLAGDARGEFVAELGRDVHRLAGHWNRWAMLHARNERCAVERRVRRNVRICATGRALIADCGVLALRPVLPVVIGHQRVDQFDRIAQSIRPRFPFPSGLAADGKCAPQAPIAFLGIVHLVRFAKAVRCVRVRVLQADRLAAICQRSDPAADDERHAAVGRIKRRRIRRDDKVAARWDAHIWKGEVRTSREFPAREIHRNQAAIIQLDVFVQVHIC